VAGSLVIPNKKASAVEEALVAIFFGCFGVPRDLHSDQSRNSDSFLIQVILQFLGIFKTSTTPLRSQSDVIVERYIKTVKEHLC
jgi:hypothetical protein